MPSLLQPEARRLPRRHRLSGRLIAYVSTHHAVTMLLTTTCAFLSLQYA